MKASTKPTNIKQIARQRIEELFKQANQVARTNPKIASEYIELARKVAMSARIPLPREFKRQICKNCNALLVQGFNCQVRLQQKRAPHVVVTCLNCGNHSRILLNKKGRVKIEQNNHSNEASC